MEGWTKHSAVYDKIFTKQLEPFARDLIQVLKKLKERPLAIHDVACGTGLLTCFLIEAFPDATISASDFSSGMLEIAKTKVSVELLQMDGQKLLALRDSSMDLITSNFGITLFPNIKRNLHEGWKAAFRVLKPGGITGLCVTLGLAIASSWKKGCRYCEFLDFFTRSRKKQPFENPHSTREGFEKLLIRAGFDCLSIETFDHVFKFESGGLFTEALLDNPYFQQAVTLLGIDAVNAIAADFFQVQVDVFLKEPLELGAACLMGVARKPAVL
jgi:ubiquinone/menaquinone biosynthesis C-methylase UbiE